MPVPNKDHWYDGWFYDTVIAPNQDRMFKQIRELIAPDSTVIDIGCGTGRFSFPIADKCSSVVGIDISKRNIDRANETLLKHPNDKISFLHAGIGEILAERNRHFDFAVMTYILHEVDEEQRIQLLRDTARIADAIIIGDYLAPRPSGFWSGLNEIVEFAAGSEHYKNYKHFVANGGLHHLIRQTGLKLVREVQNNPSTSHLVIVTKA
jgi:SAM-dependent methyltransferase